SAMAVNHPRKAWRSAGESRVRKSGVASREPPLRAAWPAAACRATVNTAAQAHPAHHDLAWRLIICTVSGRKYNNSSGALNQELFPLRSKKAIGGPKAGISQFVGKRTRKLCTASSQTLDGVSAGPRKRLPRICADERGFGKRWES